MIHRFIIQHENSIKFIATVDSNQLIPLSHIGYNNAKDLNMYINTTIDLLFPN